MSIYQSIFDIIHTYIYGGVTMTADMTLTTTLLSTGASIFVVALPFTVVWKIIKMIVGR